MIGGISLIAVSIYMIWKLASSKEERDIPAETFLYIIIFTLIVIGILEILDNTKNVM